MTSTAGRDGRHVQPSATFCARPRGRVAAGGGRFARVVKLPVAALSDLSPRQLAVSPDQKTIAAYDGHEARTVDAATGERLGSTEQADYVSGMAWTASNRCCSASGAATVAVAGLGALSDSSVGGGLPADPDSRAQLQ